MMGTANSGSGTLYGAERAPVLAALRTPENSSGCAASVSSENVVLLKNRRLRRAAQGRGAKLWLREKEALNKYAPPGALYCTEAHSICSGRPCSSNCCALPTTNRPRIGPRPVMLIITGRLSATLP